MRSSPRRIRRPRLARAVGPSSVLVEFEVDVTSGTADLADAAAAAMAANFTAHLVKGLQQAVVDLGLVDVIQTTCAGNAPYTTPHHHQAASIAFGFMLRSAS